MRNQTLTAVASASGATPKASRPTIRHPAPPELAHVALIDAPRIAAAASIGQSKFYELVRLGLAPQPAIKGPRCTRWRLGDVEAWLIELANTGMAGTSTAKNSDTKTAAANYAALGA